MLTSQPPKELRELLSELVDGQLDAHGLRRLEEILRTSPESQTFYDGFMTLHGMLLWGAGPPLSVVPSRTDLVSVADTQSQAADFLSPPPSGLLGAAWHGATGYLSNHDFVLPYSVAAVLIGIAVWVSSMIYVSHHVHVARVEPTPVRSDSHKEIVFVGRITGMVDVKWSDDPRYLPPSGFAHVPLGRKYKLDAGLLEITYDSGAKVILEGPCTYEIESTAGGYLALGKLTARVESGEWRVERKKHSDNQQSAIINHNSHSPLFSVRTPTAVVTDLGTEFGVEVDKAGTSKTHVFQGRVEMRLADGGRGEPLTIQLGVGESGQVEHGADGRGATLLRGVADPTAFASVRPGQLAQVAEERRLKPFRRWQAFSKELRKRDDLANYYDFQPDEKDRTLLRNLASTNRTMGQAYYDGRIENAAWVPGRFPGKYALRFSWPSSRIRVPIGVTDSQQLTLAAWVRLDSLPEDRASLLMSYGWWTKGLVHWQILHDGKMSFSVVVGPRVDVTGVSSRPVVDVDHPGQWILVAVACDLDAGEVVFYRNGDCVGRQAIEAPKSAAFNPHTATIANWYNPNAPLTEKDFSLQGCVGELMIFRAALSEEEIRRIYQSADVALGGTGILPVSERSTGETPVPAASGKGVSR